MTTLLDVLREADAMQVDDVFVRYFGLEEVTEETFPKDIILHIEVNADYSIWEYFFTVEELENAIPYECQEGWLVRSGDETFNITAYKLNEIKA